MKSFFERNIWLEKIVGAIIISVITCLFLFLLMYWWVGISFYYYFFISIFIGLAFILFGKSPTNIKKWIDEIIDTILAFL